MKKGLEKQQLADLEHLITKDVNNFLVLLETGSAQEIDQALHKARNDLMKFKPDMQKIAEKLGGNLPSIVDAFLTIADDVLHTTISMIDEALVSKCYQSTAKLEKELKAA